MKSQDKLKYPIGPFEFGKTYSLEETRKNIKAIARLPKELKKALKKLKSGQLDVPYRKGGWTARQVVHHLADSHMNAYIRMKLAVTEPAPIIKPYEEAAWAETEEAKFAPVKLSLKLLAPLHRRWVMFLESLPEEALDRGYFHPELQRLISLPEAIAHYAWHCRHHVAHILLVAKSKSSPEEKEAPARRPRAAAAAKTAAPAPAARKKPGPKPKAKPAEAAGTTTAERKKPGPKPKAKAAAPAKRKGMSPEHMAKIREIRMARRAAAGVTQAAATPAKRTRRTKAEMEAARAQQAAAKSAGAPVARKKPGPKPKAAVAAAVVERKKPGPKPKAAGATAVVERKKPGPKPKAAGAATQKAKPATKSAGQPKRRGMSPEHMAKIRAARAAKRAEAIAAGLIPPPKPKADTGAKRTRRSSAEVAAEKAKKAAAKASGQTKRKGMSPEHMARIRDIRMAKRAAALAAAGKTQPAKAKKQAAASPNGTPKKREAGAKQMAGIRATKGRKKS